MHTTDSESPINAVGTVFILYDPRSPVTWGMVHFNLNVSVFRSVVDAVVAMKRMYRDVWRAKRGPDLPIFFRGQSDVSFRLLPTRLRPNASAVFIGPKYLNVDPQTPSAVREKIAQVHGSWNRKEAGMRSLESILENLSADDVAQRDRIEMAAVADAKKTFEDIRALQEYQQRAAVRHYGEVPSPLLDVSEDIEVAAFMASAFTSRSDEERYGMLWAVDVRRLTKLFAHEVIAIPGGQKILLKDQRDLWGDNKRFLDEQNLPPISIELLNVELPLLRPTAQKGRFLSLMDVDGNSLPLEAELIWWSMIERWSYAVAFIQTGEVYENFQNGITRSKLLPSNDPHLGMRYDP